MERKSSRVAALLVLCLGMLMVVLDTNIVTVALPSIVADLGLSETSLTWLLNAYMVTFGGFLVLGGRLGDLYGPRRLFLASIGVFTLASLACGFARSQTVLLIARGMQGLGGAVVTAVSLSLITRLFSQSAERARAIGTFGMVCASGGGVGNLLGGVLTKAMNWHWIFLVNLPIGIGVYAFCLIVVPRDTPSNTPPSRLDVAGAITITIALTVLIYMLVNGNDSGWDSTQTYAFLGVVVSLLLCFLCIENYAREPLMPLSLFRQRNFAAANVLGALWSAGSFAWFVIAALYLQRVLNYSPLQVGLAFMPPTLIMAAFSAGLSAKIVIRLGTRRPLWIGLLLYAAGLALFARAPVSGAFVADVLPGMVLLGLGAGIASNPLLLAAMNEVSGEESGLASGVVNTSFIVGGSLGLAVLASLAEIRTGQLRQSGAGAVAALNGGYQLAFLLSAVLTAMAAAIAGLAIRLGPPKDAALPKTVTHPAAPPTATY